MIQFVVFAWTSCMTIAVVLLWGLAFHHSREIQRTNKAWFERTNQLYQQVQDHQYKIIDLESQLASRQTGN